MNRPPSLESLISPDQSDALPAVSHPPKRPGFEQRLHKANARLLELRERQQIAEALIARTLASRLNLARQRLAAQKRLFEEGLLTRQTLLAAEQLVDALSQEQAQLDSRASQQRFVLQEEQRR